MGSRVSVEILTIRTCVFLTYSVCYSVVILLDPYHSYQRHQYDNRCSTTTVMASNERLFEKLAGTHQGQLHDFPWYCYAAVVFQVHDKMELIGQTWRFVLEDTEGEDNQLRVARQMREALLKASALVGFPKVRHLNSHKLRKVLTFSRASTLCQRCAGISKTLHRRSRRS